MAEHKVLLADADERDLTQLAEYQAIGGYKGVEKARAMRPDELIAELERAVLRGRGGAGFPMGRKASLIDRKSPKPWRIHFRAPSFVALEATATCLENTLVADLIAVVGSLDAVMGDTDR